MYLGSTESHRRHLRSFGCYQEEHPWHLQGHLVIFLLAVFLGRISMWGSLLICSSDQIIYNSLPFSDVHPVLSDIAYSSPAIVLPVQAFWPVSIHYSQQSNYSVIGKKNAYCYVGCSFCYCVLVCQIIFDSAVRLNLSLQIFDVRIDRLQLSCSFLVCSFGIRAFSDIWNVTGY